MRQVRAWVENKHIGDGMRIFLLVSEGDKYAHLLHVPSLTHVKLPLAEFVKQQRTKISIDVPITRGIIGRIEHAMRVNLQYDTAFVEEALAKIREENHGKAAERPINAEAAT